MSFQQSNMIRHIDQVTNKVSNTLAQTQTGHQVFAFYPSPAFAPPSFPSRPGTLILIDCRSEGSSTVDNYARHWTSKFIRSRRRRRGMSCEQYYATTAQ